MVALSAGDGGTDGIGEKVLLELGVGGTLAEGSEKSRRRCVLVILRALSASDGKNLCSNLRKYMLAVIISSNEALLTH